ncbi:hypothetical protein E2C01_041424 [Portunus trituberculatus]|uniref:Uncharacterized protein n=1 Tax=Portunus trituberculatus TaxID=210409 RepID=A0A5B7FK11_PORTR|nr:hypothetical protein [Portunus trituberculatus]
MTIILIQRVSEKFSSQVCRHLEILYGLNALVLLSDHPSLHVHHDSEMEDSVPLRGACQHRAHTSTIPAENTRISISPIRT